MTRVITKELVSTLVRQSHSSIRRRQHLNLHDSFQEPCQRLLNAVQTDSYIRPHRHALDPRTESLFALRGVFALFLFDDAGEVASCRLFGSEYYFHEKELALGVELSPVEWHTVIALRDDSVLLEIKAGPFDPQAAKEFATWAPEEGSQDSETYLKQLRSVAVAQDSLL